MDREAVAKPLAVFYKEASRSFGVVEAGNDDDPDESDYEGEDVDDEDDGEDDEDE